MCPVFSAITSRITEETSPEKGLAGEGEPGKRHFHTEHLLCARNPIISNKTTLRGSSPHHHLNIEDYEVQRARAGFVEALIVRWVGAGVVEKLSAPSGSCLSILTPPMPCAGLVSVEALPHRLSLEVWCFPRVSEASRAILWDALNPGDSLPPPTVPGLQRGEGLGLGVDKTGWGRQRGGDTGTTRKGGPLLQRGQQLKAWFWEKCQAPGNQDGAGFQGTSRERKRGRLPAPHRR